MEKGTVHIEGIKNEQDADKVLQAIKAVWGVRDADINMNMAMICYDEKAASYTDFVQAIKDTGFEINEKRENHESL